MTEAAPQPIVAIDLRAVARGLGSIADAVRRDAEAATTSIRALEETAEETAALATTLAAASSQIEAAIAAHVDLLERTVAGTTAGLTTVGALRAAADGIGSLSATIGDIAGRSRLLALNARIEAARGGEHGLGFAVVADEMGALARSTLAATRDIEGSTDRIIGDVAATRAAFEGVNSFVGRERVMIDEIVAAAGRQRGIAADVAQLTDATRDRIDASAATIGRLGSSASAVAVMARQIIRAADAIEAEA